jgi:hypothetical protein
MVPEATAVCAEKRVMPCLNKYGQHPAIYERLKMQRNVFHTILCKEV